MGVMVLHSKKAAGARMPARPLFWFSAACARVSVLTLRACSQQAWFKGTRARWAQPECVVSAAGAGLAFRGTCANVVAHAAFLKPAPFASVTPGRARMMALSNSAAYNRSTQSDAYGAAGLRRYVAWR